MKFIIELIIPHESNSEERVLSQNEEPYSFLKMVEEQKEIFVNTLLVCDENDIEIKIVHLPCPETFKNLHEGFKWATEHLSSRKKPIMNGGGVLRFILFWKPGQFGGVGSLLFFLNSLLAPGSNFELAEYFANTHFATLKDSGENEAKKMALYFTKLETSLSIAGFNLGRDKRIMEYKKMIINFLNGEKIVDNIRW